MTRGDFDQLALNIFRFQYGNNPVYSAYIDALKIDIQEIKALSQIPFLPIQFFKSHEVRTTEFNAAEVFESSGTTQTISSRHFVKDISLYQQSFLKGFELFYGPIGEWCILGLLPSYLERKNSSLVFMTEELIRRSAHSKSGFYLYDHEKLNNNLKELESKGQRTLLLGVSFALLEFAQKYPLPLNSTIIMETGGMKGRKQEMVRNELHGLLKKAFHLNNIHSEYGMTELLSQAYSQENGIFYCPPWMRVLIRDEEDPFVVGSSESGVHDSQLTTGNSRLATPNSELLRGAVNIIDLANVYSCSFIATDDAGTIYENGSFEILGRLDNSDIRGCSLMAL
ncbi:MAG TPA: acyl transferase [Chitinophagaceae bacterium]